MVALVPNLSIRHVTVNTSYGYGYGYRIEGEDEEDEEARVTLSAFTETGQAESSIEVPKQRSYTGRKPVIPCSLADTPCAELGVQGVLDRLNAILGTYTAPTSSPSSVSPALSSVSPASSSMSPAPSSVSPAPSSMSPTPSFVFRLWKFLTETLCRYQHHWQETLADELNGACPTELNTILGTPHTLHTVPSSSTSTASPASSSAAPVQDQDRLSLLSVLKDFIEKNYDFGTAYALLRPVWNTHNPDDELRVRKGRDRKHRQKALVGNRIVDPHLTPRRVWDLCSNRVVPSWITWKGPTPISHAWVDEKDRVDVLTPINGKEWPVPIPKDANLNLIRIEMLNLGAEYVWLDVLCLRQKEEGGPREDLRVEEWRLDVPTIGRVYKHGIVPVVIYLSGLGRPLRLKDGDLDSDQSWFRRAWTLQEAGEVCIIAGDMPDGPMHAQQIDNGNYKTALLTRFHKQLHSVKRDQHDIFALLADMQKRVSTNPVDKVAGLAFPLMPVTIPAYHESETLEDAWTALVNAMDPNMRARFLFAYPGVGLGCKKWRPTWDQVMMGPLPEDIGYFATSVQHDNETDEDWFDGPCVEKGRVRRFDVESAEGHDRCGELVVEAADGIAHPFRVDVNHRFSIPDDTYTLLGDDRHYIWAIGRRLPDRRFEKMSVILLENPDEASQRLRNFSLVARTRTVLV